MRTPSAPIAPSASFSTPRSLVSRPSVARAGTQDHTTWSRFCSASFRFAACCAAPGTREAVPARRIYDYLLLQILTTFRISARQSPRPANAMPGVSKPKLRALFDIVNMWLRSAHERGPRPAWCQPPSSWDEGGGSARLDSGIDRARGVHFGETNPSCRNATAAKAARLSEVLHRPTPCYFPVISLLFTGAGCVTSPDAREGGGAHPARRAA